MKCKVCGGTGTSNTCVNGTFKPCTFCDGTGEYEPFDADIELDKLDSEPQTNEEWFDSLTTEEKAEWITNKINAKLRMALHDAELYPDDINENEYMENEDEWVEWLKQPHTEEE